MNRDLGRLVAELREAKNREEAAMAELLDVTRSLRQATDRVRDLRRMLEEAQTRVETALGIALHLEIEQEGTFP